MNTIEITVQRKSGDGWPVVAEWHQSGVFLPVRSEGDLRLDEEQLAELAALANDPLAYGTRLGQGLFAGAVLRALDRARAAGDGRLRILLSVEAPDLESLHWERLCAPLEDDAWDFLALDQRAPFSLYLPSTTDRRFPAIGQRDLRALLLVANPEGLAGFGLAEFDAAGTVASVQQALGDIPCDVLASVEGALGPPTLDALCERITAGQYTLLHVVAHGGVREGETSLYLAGEGDQVAPVTDTDLIRRLRRLEGARGLPHFTFLSTCESARPEAAAGLGGLAGRLVEKLGVPAVLAMTETVTIDTAEALAGRFYQQLREHGEPDRALVEACAGLAGRPDVTVPALYSRLGGRPLFSDAEDRDLTGTEISYALDELARLLPERAPVVEEEFAAQAGRLRGMLAADRADLSREARAEWDEALVELNALCEEVLDLNFRALALGQAPPAYDARCPFPGLLAFGVDDHEFFFGRGPLVRQLLARLADEKFLAVLGPSGSGKSSLVLAGLVPALRAGDPDLRLAYLTPGSDPEAQLAKALATLDSAQRASPDPRSAPAENAPRGSSNPRSTPTENASRGLPNPRSTPTENARRGSSDPRSTLLVVDQFEELFTLCTDEEARERFLERLLKLAAEMPVVLTMRADFWGECAPYRELKEAMLAHQELIAPMDAAELRRAMELQAAAVGLRFEADLANTILDEVQGEPGAMPLLQHALRELWERRHGRWLRAEEYRSLGGVRRAIAQTADQVYEKSSPEAQERLRDIFVRLTRLDKEPVRGEERRDTRRRVSLEDLVPAGGDLAATKALVKRLADARLVVTGVNAVTGREEVEVAHEALIRHWRRLRDWLDEDRVGLRLREGIGEAARQWREREQDESYLVHRGSRLEDAETLSRDPRFPLSRLEQAYVDACVALRERQRAKEKVRRQRELEQERRNARNLRRAAIVVGVVAVVALAAFVFAFLQLQVADRERTTAEEQRGTATSALATAELGRATATSAVATAVLGQSTAVAAQEAAVAERDRAEQQAREARLALSGQLVLQAQAVDEDYPQRRLLLALEALNVLQVDDPRVPSAEQALRDALGKVEGLALGGHGDSVRSLEFSRDGRWLATTGSDDDTVRLWDLTAEDPAAEPLVLAGHEGEVSSVAFSRDSRWLYTGSWDDTARLWDLAAEDPAAEPLVLAGHEGRISSMAFSPNGRWLATTGRGDNTVRLWDLAAEDPAAEPLVLAGYKGMGRPLVFSPNSRWLTSGSRYAITQLWDLAAEDPVAEPLMLRGHERGFESLEFSRDGRWLATTGRGDDTARLWDLWALEGLAAEDPAADPLVLTGHWSPVDSMAFSRNSRWLATTGIEDAVALLWELAAEDPAAEPLVLAGHRGRLNSMAFSQDSRWLATTGSKDATARLWDMGALEGLAAEDPAAEPLVLAGHEGLVRSLAFSQDSRWLATAVSEDATARLWDLAAEDPAAEPLELAGHEGEVWSVAFSPDGRWLATGSGDNTARLWDLAAEGPAAEPLVLTGHEYGIGSVAFSRDGHWLATTGRLDATARLWDLAAEEPVADPLELAGHEDGVYSVAFSPEGRWLATTASGDATARLWDLWALEGLAAEDPAAEPLVLAGHKSRVQSVAFSRNGRWLATGSGDATARLWDLWALEGLAAEDPAAEPLVLAGHEGDVSSVAFSPDGHWLATGSGDATARLWDLWALGDLAAEDPAAEPLVLAGHEDGVRSVAFSPEGRWLATTGRWDRTVRLWDLGAEDPAAEPLVLAGHGDDWVSSLAFSLDGRWLATTGSEDTAARLWDLWALEGLAAEDPAAEPLVRFGHKDEVDSVAFSRDGRWLATGSEDGTARLWDLWALEGLAAEDPAAEPLVLAGHEGKVWSVAFSADGRWLATGSEDATARLWRLQLEELKGVACRVVGRNLTQDEWADYVWRQDYHRTCERWPAHPGVVRSYLDEGLELSQAGDVEGALARFQRAIDLDPDFEIETRYWKDLCRFGSLWGHAADVLHACEKGVALAPDDGSVHDSRGLARALTGDFQGAIEDFAFFVEWAGGRIGYLHSVSERESWIAELEAGRNPFDEETLEALRGE